MDSEKLGELGIPSWIMEDRLYEHTDNIDLTSPLDEASALFVDSSVMLNVLNTVMTTRATLTKASGSRSGKLSGMNQARFAYDLRPGWLRTCFVSTTKWLIHHVLIIDFVMICGDQDGIRFGQNGFSEWAGAPKARLCFRI